MTIFIFLSVVLPFPIFMLHFGAAACGDACDTATSWTAELVFLVFDGVLFVGIMVPYTLRANRWQRTWWLPAAGITALLAGTLAANIVIRVALPVL